MTAAQTTDSNLTFSQLASDERIARTVAALGPRGVTAEVVQNGAAERARILELLPLGAEGVASDEQPARAGFRGVRAKSFPQLPQRRRLKESNPDSLMKRSDGRRGDAS